LVASKNNGSFERISTKDAGFAKVTTTEKKSGKLPEA
jgi:hypothetical protein